MCSRLDARLRLLTLASSLLVAAAPLMAQDLTPKAPPQDRPVAIINATVHPVSSAPVENAGVLFEKGVITRVGQLGDLPRDARVIDARGMHVYPGLISGSSQIGLTEIQAVPATLDFNEAGEITPEARPSININPDSTLIPVTRSNGVLTAGVFPTGGMLPGQVSVIRLDGWTMDDMVVRDSAGFILRWPQMRTITAWWMDRSEDDQKRDIERELTRVREVFETARAYADLREADPSTSVDLRWEAMRPLFAKENKARLFVLANDVDQISAALAFASERGLRIAIVGGRQADLVGDTLKAADVPVVILGTHVMPRRDDSPVAEAFSLPLRLHQAGVRFCLAYADDTAHERNLPYAAATAAAFGLPREEALRSITLSAAEILGVGDRLGSLDVGKAATLIITTGDPLDIRTETRQAFIDGREVDLSNKQRKLYDKYRERYRQLELIPADGPANPPGGGGGGGGGGGAGGAAGTR